MGIEQIVQLVAACGLVPIVVIIFVWLIIEQRKSEAKTKESMQKTMEQYNDASQKRNEETMKIIMQLLGSMNTVQEGVTKTHEQVAGGHSKEEVKKVMKSDLAINDFLQHLVADSSASRAYFLTYHNGSKNVLGQGMSKLSITNEAFDKWSVPVMGEIQALPVAFFGGIIKSIDEKAGFLCVNSLEDLKEPAANFYNFAHPRGVASCIIQNVQTPSKDILGFIVLEFNNETDVQGLKSIQKQVKQTAASIAGAIQASTK